MQKIAKIDLHNLDERTKIALQSMTESKFYPCLQGNHPDGISDATILVFAAFEENQPIALLIATAIPALKSAEIHSLFVHEKYRNRKIAQMLLEQFENEIRNLKVTVVTFLYVVENNFSDIYEHVFQKNKWEKPSLFSVNCVLQNNFNAPWLNRNYPLPDGLHEVFWTQLTQQEKEQLRSEVDRSIMPLFLSPFGKDEELIESANSLVLIHEKRVIGWMITHRITSDTIRYTSLYIIPEWQHKGPAMRLLCDAIKFQTHSSIPWALFETNLNRTDKAWAKALEEKVMPYAHTITHVNQVWKKF